MDERQQTAAKRILELVPSWDRPSGTEEELIDSIYNEISLDPIPIINFLLDLIDDLNA